MARGDQPEGHGVRSMRGGVLVGAGVVALSIVLGVGWMVIRALVVTPRVAPDIVARQEAVIAQTRIAVGFRNEPDRWPDLLQAIGDVASVGGRLPADPVFGTNVPDFTRVSDPDHYTDQLKPEAVSYTHLTLPTNREV